MTFTEATAIVDKAQDAIHAAYAESDYGAAQKLGALFTLLASACQFGALAIRQRQDGRPATGRVYCDVALTNAREAASMVYRAGSAS